MMINDRYQNPPRRAVRSRGRYIFAAVILAVIVALVALAGFAAAGALASEVGGGV